MKKQLFFGFLGALALTACSNEDLVNPEGGNTNNEGGVQHFLTVNIVSTPTAGALSKAGVQHPDSDPTGNATYEEGEENENIVTAVRFYFFDSNGNSMNVKYGSDANYYDWNKGIETDGQNHPNVEKQLKATLVISTADQDQVPSKMVAVVNPSAELLKRPGALSLNALRQLTRNYASLATDGKFIMFNSAYAAGTSEVYATSIPQYAYQPSEELAESNPVNIYVERNVAKVRVTYDQDLERISITAGGNTFKAIALKDKDGKNILVDGKQVYLRLSAWNLTAETDLGSLGKTIDAKWPTDLFGANEPWNYDPFFRSFWATNTSEAKQNWHSYNDIDNSGTDYESGFLYANENAPYQLACKTDVSGADVENFTKVIMAGQLVDAAGKSITICKYAGLTMAGTSKLKEALLTQLRANGMVYSVEITEDNGVKKYNVAEITEEDVDFTTALDAKIDGVTGSETTSGRYYSYLKLSNKGLSKKTYTYNNDETTFNEETDILTTDDVNNYFINQLGHSIIYNTGMTYYYFPIRHLAGDVEDGVTGEGDAAVTNYKRYVGYYGVVRNHIYDCTINSIAGLGTPVYNPGETIWPEKPKEEDTFIAAKINILSWRVVPNNIDLEW